MNIKVYVLIGLVMVLMISGCVEEKLNSKIMNGVNGNVNQTNYVFDRSKFCPDQGDCIDYGLESRKCDKIGDCVASCSYGCVNKEWLKGRHDCDIIWPNFECECIEGICQRKRKDINHIVNTTEQNDSNRSVGYVRVFSDPEPVPVNNTKKEVSKNAKKALKHIAKTNNISEEQLEIVNEGEATFPLTKQKLWGATVLDKKSGKIYYIYLDKYGNIADFRKAKEEEDKAYKAKYGKLEQALYEKLQNMSVNDKIKVAIWLTPIDSEKIEKDVLSKYPDVKMIRGRIIPSENLTNEEVKKIRDEIFKEKKKAYEAKSKPLIDEMKKKGLDVGYASISAPVVFANLNKEEIFALEKRDDVVAIYLSRTYEPELNSAIPAIRAPFKLDEGQELTFETVSKGVHSGHDDKKNYVIKNNIEFGNLWDIVHSRAFPKPDLPTINFNEEMIIAVFQGARGSGGHRIEITKIIEKENSIEVFVKETIPAPGSIVTQAFTWPYHIIKTKKTDKEVIFKTEVLYYCYGC